MIVSMINLLFGCRHRHFTRPITPIRKHGDHHAETYISCLECGKQFHYDATNMRMGTAIIASTTTNSNHPTYGRFQSQ